MIRALAGVSRKVGWTAWARWTKSCTAAARAILSLSGRCVRLGTSRGETGRSYSPEMRRGARLVVNRCGSGQYAKDRREAGRQLRAARSYPATTTSLAAEDS